MVSNGGSTDNCRYPVEDPDGHSIYPSIGRGSGGTSDLPCQSSVERIDGAGDGGDAACDGGFGNGQLGLFGSSSVPFAIVEGNDYERHRDIVAIDVDSFEIVDRYGSIREAAGGDNSIYFSIYRAIRQHQSWNGYFWCENGAVPDDIGSYHYIPPRGVVRKSVTAYDAVTHEFVSHFDSMDEAAEVVGISNRYRISSAIKHRTHLGGLFWTYKGDPVPDFSKYKHPSHQAANRSVFAIDCNTLDTVSAYGSIKNAAIANSVPASEIGDAIETGNAYSRKFWSLDDPNAVVSHSGDGSIGGVRAIDPSTREEVIRFKNAEAAANAYDDVVEQDIIDATRFHCILKGYFWLPLSVPISTLDLIAFDEKGEQLIGKPFIPLDTSDSGRSDSGMIGGDRTAAL